MSSPRVMSRYTTATEANADAVRAAVAALSRHPLRAARVIELARGGASPSVIAARLGLGAARVRDILNANRVIKGRLRHVPK